MAKAPATAATALSGEDQSQEQSGGRRPSTSAPGGRGLLADEEEQWLRAGSGELPGGVRTPARRGPAASPAGPHGLTGPPPASAGRHALGQRPGIRPTGPPLP